VNNINYLLLSDSKDFTTDYVAIELEKRNVSYLRLDRDLLPGIKISWDISKQRLLVERNGDKYLIDDDTLKGVYYRAPTYLRETFSRNTNVEDQLKQSQWMSFYRNLLCFSKARWINSPSATFFAENKMVQLKFAQEIGFKIPKTILANNADDLGSIKNPLIVKSLDTAVFSFDDSEAFVYTNTVSYDELKSAELSIAPAIFQENLSSKTDYRVTVIDNVLFAVKILLNGHGFAGDWRKEKDNVSFVPAELSDEVSNMCYQIVKRLGLSFGAIDLIYSNNEYYFVEVNPTGEWAWLVDSAGHKIYMAICDFLTGDRP